MFNDIDFIPWIRDDRVFTPAALRAHVHLDLHEYFPPHLPPGSRLRFRVDEYHGWLRSFIADARFTTRTTVAGGIARVYADELGVPDPPLVRNAPPYVDLSPGPVTDRIRLMHHGGAQLERGLRELVDAVREVGPSVELTFMLTGSEAAIGELRDRAQGAEHIRFVPPVALNELAREVNAYDLEVMFYPPASENLRFALPNKLFEAVQGRLGLVIGPSPSMSEIVEQYDNGVITAGWETADLVQTLRALTPQRVRELKAGSDRAARDLSAEHEREQFMRAVGIRPS